MTANAVRLEGYAFVFDTNSGSYTKKPERRVRIVSLIDAQLIINVMPATVDLENLSYQVSASNHLVITDGKSFSLDINEFGISR